ncbi:MAG: hypothetical protein HQL87_12075 [Magnetococcales bacterium]|nr:hypothetical protein [Magnetococcales bacterium]
MGVPEMMRLTEDVPCTVPDGVATGSGLDGVQGGGEAVRGVVEPHQRVPTDDVLVALVAEANLLLARLENLDWQDDTGVGGMAVGTSNRVQREGQVLLNKVKELRHVLVGARGRDTAG